MYSCSLTTALACETGFDAAEGERDTLAGLPAAPAILVYILEDPLVSHSGRQMAFGCNRADNRFRSKSHRKEGADCMRSVGDSPDILAHYLSCPNFMSCQINKIDYSTIAVP